MFEADITKVVEEMAISIRETQEDFILDTIFPYCQETLQRKINKAELKQIILRGSRPKGKWNFIGYQMFECSSCKSAYTQNQFEELRLYTTDDLLPKYCPNCGSHNGG